MVHALLRPTAAVTNLSYKSLISVQRATTALQRLLAKVKLVSYYTLAPKNSTKRVGEL